MKVFVWYFNEGMVENLDRILFVNRGMYYKIFWIRNLWEIGRLCSKQVSFLL